MSPDASSRKRVSVEQQPTCFIVIVDSQPVLRCAGHRDALRYAVIVRRALERSKSLQSDDASSPHTSPSTTKRQLSPTHRRHK